ncbi:hypothetical protein DBB42_16860 [Pseudomonas plecoglossicida]|uniref:Uncharacterized protein n=1 Tax=Pseudomonas plecoglossicida TaxID=70775 RepID=A0A2R7UKA0_PSEDL|nr:hypothetical protein DBB42_16860 [Pseudomonas plecoglossicida]RFQ02269.1 hypothetical protein D0O09_12910 [Pseudomonas putida]
MIQLTKQDSSSRYWGCFAALRGHARSHRDLASPEPGAAPVGAGVPAKGRKATQNHSTDWHQPQGSSLTEQPRTSGPGTCGPLPPVRRSPRC